MFAGPNGSGKSTIQSVLPPELLSVYINPDEIESEVRATHRLDLYSRGIQTSLEEVQGFFLNSTLTQQEYSREDVAKIRLKAHSVDFSAISLSPYLFSAAADLLRTELLHQGRSFTFETVMSHRSKVDFLQTALQQGYRTYLYYIATEDPEINVSRVRNRVLLGGHDVPEDKIRSRYYRSLDLLYEAILNSSRAYIFDNSRASGDHFLIAEATNGSDLELKSDEVPAWFNKAVLDKAVG